MRRLWISWPGALGSGAALILLAGCSGASGGGSNPTPTQAATPAVSPSGGSFTTVQTVTVTDSTQGASIHCTTDGSTPTAASPACPSLSLGITTTVKAYASAAGYTDSATATAAFTFPTPTQAATPVISPSGGSFTTVQAVTVTDSTPGASIHCTTDGSTPTAASPACPSLSLGITTTVKAYASAAGYTDSATATAVFTISIPQAISLPATLTVPLDGTLALTSANVTASGSCPPSAVTFTVTQTSTDTAKAAGAVFASYSSDSTGSTFGQLLAGNSIPEDKINTYRVVAACGTASSTSLLTVTIPAPTITAAAPTVVKATSDTRFDLTGSNFSAQSATSTDPKVLLTQWQGTVAWAFVNTSGCTTQAGGAGTVWVSATDIQARLTSNALTLGAWNYAVMNGPAADGNGGGQACLANAFSVVANTSNVVAVLNARAVVDLGTATQPGTATVYQSSGAVAQYVLGLGAGSPVPVGNALFVPNKIDSTISKIDVSTGVQTAIRTGTGYAPVILAASGSGVLYAAAELKSDPSQGAILRVADDGSITRIASADGFTSLAVSGTRLLWTTTVSGARTSTVHVFDTSGSSETSSALSLPADSVMVLSDGSVLAYQSGKPEVSILDPASLTELGTADVGEGILGFNGDHLSRIDGSILQAKVVSNGSVKPHLATTLRGNEPVSDLYGGFMITAAEDVATVTSAHRLAGGRLVLQSHTVAPQ